MTDQPKRLYRSQSNRMIAGVCGGIAEYLGVDPTAVRIAWVILSIFPLIPGILIYIIAWIVIPVNPTGASGPPRQSSVSFGAVIGVVLIALGGILLLENLEVINWWRWWETLWDYAVPVLLISIGVFFIAFRRERIEKKDSGEPAVEAVSTPHETERKSLHRSSTDRKLFGVCGGLAVYFGVDPSLVRIAFVFFSFWPFGLGAVVYLVLLLIMPEEPASWPQPQT